MVVLRQQPHLHQQALELPMSGQQAGLPEVSNPAHSQNLDTAAESQTRHPNRQWFCNDEYSYLDSN